MDTIWLILAGMLVMGGYILYIALAGPSVTKAKKRRLTAVRDRHLFSTGAVVAAQMRRIQANRTTKMDSFALKILPNSAQLKKRLAASGKTWTYSQYLFSCGIVSVVVALVVLTKMWMYSFALVFAIVFGLAMGLYLPHFFLNQLIARRRKKFNVRFPDAIELLVRGLRSGLPISETLQVVAKELPGPVGEEFTQACDKIRIGRTMDSALQDIADKLGTPEFQFFCITLQIQRETGGNLAETLSNLATVLRQRGQMQLKIRAMSSESKASAYIIGSLPFIVFILIYQINPNYMTPFWTNPQLTVVGLGGLCWMGIGAYIMKQMISFEI